MLQIEGSGGSEIPYLGRVEAHLRVPEGKAFDTDVLLLITPDSAHTTHYIRNSSHRHGDQFGYKKQS